MAIDVRLLNGSRALLLNPKPVVRVEKLQKDMLIKVQRLALTHGDIPPFRP